METTLKNQNHKYLAMNYKKIYIRLCDRALERVIDGYIEKHHIIPRCLGGKDTQKNIVKLTAREHYLAHLLLVKIFPNNHKLVFAAKTMCRSSNGQRIDNKLYEWLRKKHAEAQRNMPEETRRKIGEKSKGRIGSAEVKAKQSEAHKNISDETRAKMSASGKGRKRSEETKRKMAEAAKRRPKEHYEKIVEARKGYKHSPETLAKMSESIKKQRREAKQQH